MKKLIDNFYTEIFKVSEKNPFTNIYGLARSILALSTFCSLLMNNPYLIFKPIAGVDKAPVCVNEATTSFFCIFQNYLSLNQTIILALMILFIVIIGFAPRYTSILHYWIAFSYSGSATVIDGGDQVNTVLTLLLIPICILDNRKWVWSNLSITHPLTFLNRIKNLIGWSTFTVISLQVAIIYINASLEKLKVSEWTNGTAVYYYFNSNTLGMSDLIRPLVEPLINSPMFVVLITYGTILLEFLLFSSIFMSQKAKYILFFIATFFHFNIILVHGLPTFFFAMLGALILFLIPKEKKLVLNSYYKLKYV